MMTVAAMKNMAYGAGQGVLPVLGAVTFGYVLWSSWKTHLRALNVIESAEKFITVMQVNKIWHEAVQQVFNLSVLDPSCSDPVLMCTANTYCTSAHSFAYFKDGWLNYSVIPIECFAPSQKPLDDVPALIDQTCTPSCPSVHGLAAAHIDFMNLPSRLSSDKNRVLEAIENVANTFARHYRCVFEHSGR